jgi:hypothetical protein
MLSDGLRPAGRRVAAQTRLSGPGRDFGVAPQLPLAADGDRVVHDRLRTYAESWAMSLFDIRARERPSLQADR